MTATPRRIPSSPPSSACCLAGALGACGSGDDEAASASGASGAEPRRVVVSAAASLKRALTSYGERFEGADVRLSFAGSDELAAQIRQGIKPDVFAAANTKLPDQLFAEGLVERPVRFATNELVLAVPAGSDTVGPSTTSPRRR
jgi:molybdate transport system substrate-binding protein